MPHASMHYVVLVLFRNVQISYYQGMAPDLAHLKSPAGMALWTPLAMLHLEPGQQDVRLDLLTPITATAVRHAPKVHVISVPAC